MRRSDAIRRPGYTLIELIVVIGIIVLLASILLPAIVKIQAVGPRVKTAAEIGELELSVESFKSTYQVTYVPSALLLCSDYNAVATANPTWAPALQDSARYLSKVWPKVNWSTSGNPALPANTNIQLDGNQVLVFLLGGPGPTDSRFTSGWNGKRAGFYNSTTNPFNISGGMANSPPTGAQAKGPFFDFKADRIDQNSHYLDPYGHEYYYFSSKFGNDYSFFGNYQPALNPGNVSGGFDTLGGYGGMDPFIGLDGKFIRSDTFQIISAGKDKSPGPGGSYNPGVLPYAPGAPGGDDLANFHNGMLGSDG